MMTSTPTATTRLVLGLALCAGFLPGTRARSLGQVHARVPLKTAVFEPDTAPSPPEPQGNAAAFNPPWNDDPASIQNWGAWCANERREGCYACKNAGGAGKYCTAMCAEMGCPIRPVLVKIPAPPPAPSCTVNGVLDARDPLWGRSWGNTCATLTDGNAGWDSPGQGFHLGNGEVLDIRFSGRKAVSRIKIETGLGAADSIYMPQSFKVEYITEGGQLKLAQEYGPGLTTAGTSSYRIVLAGALASAEIVDVGDFLSNPNAKVQWKPAPANAGGPKIGVTGLRITNTGGSSADQWLRLAQVSVL